MVSMNLHASFQKKKQKNKLLYNREGMMESEPGDVNRWLEYCQCKEQREGEKYVVVASQTPSWRMQFLVRWLRLESHLT